MKIIAPQSNKWITTAIAATAGAGGANAAVVQITLTGNQINTTTGNALVADLTGDGFDDVTFSGALFTRTSMLTNAGGFRFSAKVNINSGQSVYGKAAAAPFQTVRANFASGVGTAGPSSTYGNTITNSFLNQVTFTDLRINNGALTTGYLQIQSTSAFGVGGTVALTRLVFNDASPTLAAGGLNTGTTYDEFQVVPEVSSLALLALGAGGLVFRRQRPAA